MSQNLNKTKDEERKETKMQTLITANPKLFARFYKASSDANNTIKKADEIINPPHLIQILKSTVRDVSNSKELSKFFSKATGGDKGFTKLSQTEYVLGEYKILVAVSDQADSIEDNLKIANALYLQSAPILIEKINSKNSDLKVLITYEPGLKGDISQYDTFASADRAGKLDPQAKRILMKEIETLYDGGYVNPTIVEDRISLKVNPKSGLIFASNWESLEIPDQKDKAIYLESVKRALQIY